MRRRPITLSLLAFALGCTVTEIETDGGVPTPIPSQKAEPAEKEGKQAEPPEEEGKQAAPPKPDRPPVDFGVEARIVDPDDASVTLVAAGADPKQPLRLTPKKGAKQSLELKMKMTMSMDIAIQKVEPRELPEIRVKLDTKVESLSPLRYSFVVTGAERDETKELSARVMTAVDKAVDGLKGNKGSIEIDARGNTKKIDIELPDVPHAGLRPSLLGFRQAFSQFFVAFPEEPVGVGGRWKAITHFEQSGVATQQTATYTLESRDGDAVNVAVKFEQAATTKDLGKKDVPGAEIEVQEFGAVGSGKIELDLSSVAPRVGEATSRSATKSKVLFGGGGAQDVGMGLVLALSLRDIAAK